MATIIRFNIPTVVLNLICDQWDTLKIVNAVQSELNAGTILKSKTTDEQKWKAVKDDDGNERMVIIAATKTGERIQLENGKGNRFYAWCGSMVRLQSFGATEFTIPKVYVDWFNQFAKLEAPVSK